MAIANTIAQAGIGAGRNIQNTVSNGLVRRENQKRYEAQQLAQEKAAQTEQMRYQSEQSQLQASNQLTADKYATTQARNVQLDQFAQKKQDFEEIKHGDQRYGGWANTASSILNQQAPENRAAAYKAILKNASYQGINLEGRGLPEEYTPDALINLSSVGAPTSASGMPKVVGGVMTDQETGQNYSNYFDPANKQFYRGNIPNSTSLTDSEKQTNKANIEFVTADKKKAYDAGMKAWDAAVAMKGTTAKLGKALSALENGAKSGWFDQMMPAFSTATAQLKEVARGMGIDILGMVTFGALSEKELNLALQQGLPMELNEPELKAFIKEKIRVTGILRDDIEEEADRYMSGKGLSELLKENINNRMVKPENIEAVDWALLSNDAQRQYIQEGRK